MLINIKKGYGKCHYESEYPTDYLDIKIKRIFLCEVNKRDFYIFKGKCIQCFDVGLYNYV